VLSLELSVSRSTMIVSVTTAKFAFGDPGVHVVPDDEPVAAENVYVFIRGCSRVAPPRPSGRRLCRRQLGYEVAEAPRRLGPLVAGPGEYVVIPHPADRRPRAEAGAEARLPGRPPIRWLVGTRTC
jgi:hypothetical protein